MAKVYNVTGTAEDSSGKITFNMNVGAMSKTEARLLVQDEMIERGLSNPDASGKVVFLGANSKWNVGRTLWLT